MRVTTAVPELQKLATEPARGAVDEALAALGKIATTEALGTVRTVLAAPVAGTRLAAAHAALAAADRLLKAGTRADAVTLLESVVAAEVPGHLRAAATALLAKSPRVPHSREMVGYQEDVATGYWGGLYDESRRAKFLGSDGALASAGV